MPTFHPPYLGAAYYPEDWPIEQIDQDIALMKRAGMNAMRIAEFAWSRMEPQEGQYDFDWLHLTVDKLAKAGIATIIGTPTCTPPAWLSERYPEIRVMDDHGLRLPHGARRHACPNSPVYRGHCTRIVTRMAQEFGDDPRIIGWQIDNELYLMTPRGCCCPVCVEKFDDWLRNRFGTIEKLNEAWCTNLWSQTYQSFAQVPVPRHDMWLHHPSLQTAWMVFQSDSYVDFSNHQADLLHKLVKQPVGTDMMPLGGVNYGQIHRKLDMVQYNHYDAEGELYRQVFWMDMCRALKARPWWNTETSACWNGSVAAMGYRKPGFCRANSWMPIALGAELNMYWLWRAHWAGQELMHGCVIDTVGRPVHIFEEVQEIAAGFRKAGKFIMGTRPTMAPSGGVAVHFSGLAWCMWDNQPIAHGFTYREGLVNQFYRSLSQTHLRADVIDPAADLDAYRVVCSPFLPALDESGLRGRLKKWIEAGGTWIAGPMTDIRTIEATKFTHAPFGSLEEWAGIYGKYGVPGTPIDLTIQWPDGTKAPGSIWYDVLDPRKQPRKQPRKHSRKGSRSNTEAIATYAEGQFKGLAAVTRTRVGKGQIIVLGTMPRAAELKKLLLDVAASAGVKPAAEASADLLVVPREGKAGKGMIVVEHAGKPAQLTLPRAATDLLTGKRHAGTVEVPEYGVMVLKY